MKPKSFFLIAIFCTVFLCGCRSGTAINVASTANPDVFPQVFKFSQVRDETLHAAVRGNLEEMPAFVQNYITNICLKSGTDDKNLLLRKMQINSARNVRMIEKILLANGYRKAAPNEANCEVSICYGEGNRDGRRIELDESSPFSASVSRAKPRSIVESQSVSSATGETVTTRTTHSRGGKVVTPRARKQVFKLGFLQVSCDLLLRGGERRCVWEMTLSKKQKTDFETEFAFLAYGAGKKLGTTTVGIEAVKLRNADVKEFFPGE